jgi:hypothetical protein
MDVLKEKYDRILLIAFALIGLAVSVYLLNEVLGFSATLGDEEVAGNNEIPDSGLSTVSQAKTALESEHYLTPKVIDENKKAHVARSVPFISKGGETIDILDKNSVPVRPPVPNYWLFVNELPITEIDVLDQDPDGDSYENVIEWQSNTDPNDPRSKPDWSTKLFLVERIVNPLSMKFAAAIDPDFQMTRTAPKRRNFFIQLGAEFDNEDIKDGALRFVLQKFIPAGADAIRDPAQVTLFDKKTQKSVTIAEGETKDLPTYSAKLLLENKNEEKIVQKGDIFQSSPTSILRSKRSRKILS